MQTLVILPDLGVSDAATLSVSFWFADEGDEVIEGDRLVELVAGPVTIDVPAPATGRLVEIRVTEEDAVHAGDILAIVESEHDDASD